ncbi:MAG: ABC transporter permease [Oscillospiraceae bacterium]
MLKFTAKRLLQSLLTLFIVATVLLRLMPESGYFGEEYDKLDEGQREAILTQMGLRDPITTQLLNFYKGILHGDLGKSIVFRPNVAITKIIAPKIPYSVYFGLASITLGLVIGVPMGMMMARFRNGFLDKLGSGYVVLINAVPAAVYFLMIQLYVSKAFGLPMMFNDSKPISWILPAFSMSLSGIAYYAMWVRRYMVDELNRDYIKLARAKGMTNSAIMYRHVIRNAFVPLAQYLPANILLTISGSIYVESLFSIPGMGGLIIAAIQRQDNTLVQALVLIYSSVGICGLFLGDILMALCDPRIKLEKKGGAR